jgi:RNA polymerase sigma-70 factor (ECF subfamily)
MKLFDQEQRLLQEARQLKSQALARIYDEYSPGIYRYAMRLLGDNHLAEDCVAETFTRFLQALRDRRGPRDHLQAYLYRVAHNWIADHYRREKPWDELKDTLACESENIEHSVARRLRRAQMRQAIAQLTPDQQQVIALKFLEGWDNQEIAQTIGKPVGAIKSLQHRALASLQKQLSFLEKE